MKNEIIGFMKMLKATYTNLEFKFIFLCIDDQIVKMDKKGFYFDTLLANMVTQEDWNKID